jgi:hypothetical protein
MDAWLTREPPERTIWPTPRTPARVTDMPTVAAEHLGGFLRPHVRSGTRGVVTARAPDGRFLVAFVNGRSHSVSEAQLLLLDLYGPR